MLKVVITADFHLKTIDKYGKIGPTGLNSRLIDALDNITKSVDYAIKQKASHWICTGDIFHKINPSETLRRAFLQVITPLIRKDIKIILLTGNHDTDFKIHSFMTESELLRIVDKNVLITIPQSTSLILAGVKCLFIPFMEDYEVEKALKEADKDVIVFGHFGIDGALVSGTEYILSKGISQKLLQPFRYSYLGHYHKPQTTSKWMFIGSISKVDFGERNDKKGFIYAEIPTTGKIRHKFIDVKDRVFFQHEINQEEDPDFKTLYKWQNLKGKIVKLTFIGEEDWWLRFNLGEIRSKILKEEKAHKLFIDHKTKFESRIRVPEINASSSWYEGIEIYCKKLKRPDMVELGKSILTEVI